MNSSLIILIALIVLVLFFALGIVVLVHDIHTRLTRIETLLDRNTPCDQE